MGVSRTAAGSRWRGAAACQRRAAGRRPRARAAPCHARLLQFPSVHFYGGRLRDAAAIAARPPAPYYDHPLMKPYVVFDVARGRERRREGGGSLSNRVREGLVAEAGREGGVAWWCHDCRRALQPPLQT